MEEEDALQADPSECTAPTPTCVIGTAMRSGVDPGAALASALDAILYRGVRPSIRPLSRSQASARVVSGHCSAHRPEAAAILARLTPSGGITFDRPTPPPHARGLT